MSQATASGAMSGAAWGFGNAFLSYTAGFSLGSFALMMGRAALAGIGQWASGVGTFLAPAGEITVGWVPFVLPRCDFMGTCPLVEA